MAIAKTITSDNVSKESSTSQNPSNYSKVFNRYTIPILVGGGYLLAREFLGWEVTSTLIVTATTAFLSFLCIDISLHCFADRVPNPKLLVVSGLRLGTVLGIISGISIAAVAEGSFRLLRNFFNK